MMVINNDVQVNVKSNLLFQETKLRFVMFADVHGLRYLIMTDFKNTELRRSILKA